MRNNDTKDYKKVIIEVLLRKYYNRHAKNMSTNRRIILKPTEIYRNYAKNNADIIEKQSFNEDVTELKSMGIISVDYLKYSEDIEKIYLCEEKFETMCEYLRDVYGVIPQSVVSRQVRDIIEAYSHAGIIVQKYSEDILAQIEDPRKSVDYERVKANLKMLYFLEKNKEDLYVREASILVYGDSKWFENHNYDEICTLLKNTVNIPRKEDERNDTILAHYHIMPTEQEVFIKGDWKIKWEQYILETDRLQGGIAIATKDIRSIRRITVNSPNLLTVENKTSYQRLKGHNMAIMYLGGFASWHQIQFLKKVIQDNPNITYLHFGDIDIGGFLIHKHLCRETSKNFRLFCMGVSQLRDKRFQNCLKKLTEHDLVRLEGFPEEDPYREVLAYMKEFNVKLEQEIVSYYLKSEA